MLQSFQDNRGSPIGFSGSGISLIRGSEFGKFKAKLGRESGLKVSSEGGMPEISLGITGLNEILGRNSEIKELYWVLIPDSLRRHNNYVSTAKD